MGPLAYNEYLIVLEFGLKKYLTLPDEYIIFKMSVCI